MNAKKASFFISLSDALLKLTYYDRKASDLTPDDVETLLNSGEVTLAEIQAEVAKFFTNSFKMPVNLEAIPDLRSD